MTAIYDLFLHIYKTTPPELSAMLMAWVVSVTITQPLKFILPLNWWPRLREGLTQGSAFLTAFVTCFALLPTKMGALLGFVVGIWSPVAYYLLVRVLGRQYPWLQDILSGDVRSALFTSKPIRENRPT